MEEEVEGGAPLVVAVVVAVAAAAAAAAAATALVVVGLVSPGPRFDPPLPPILPALLLPLSVSSPLLDGEVEEELEAARGRREKGAGGEERIFVVVGSERGERRRNIVTRDASAARLPGVRSDSAIV